MLLLVCSGVFVLTLTVLRVVVVVVFGRWCCAVTSAVGVGRCGTSAIHVESKCDMFLPCVAWMCFEAKACTFGTRFFLELRVCGWWGVGVACAEERKGGK